MTKIRKILLILLSKKIFIILPDKIYLKIRYKLKMKKSLNLKNPKTFTEKLQWLKIYDRKKIYSTMVDKYDAKQYIEKTVGQKYNVKTYGIYNKFSEIDINKLPDKFIMKCTHNSGGTVVCNNKENFNILKTKEKLEKILSKNYYNLGREWPYKNVKPRIIVEELLENEDGTDLIEYNFFCFNGIPKIVMTCHGDKRIKRYNDFYDMQFNKLDLKCEYATSDFNEDKPSCFEEMIRLSKKLSKNTYFLRVDFYLVNNQIKVGELTFYHWSGLCQFSPSEYDMKLGDMLSLPIDKD